MTMTMKRNLFMAMIVTVLCLFLSPFTVFANNSESGTNTGSYDTRGFNVQDDLTRSVTKDEVASGGIPNVQVEQASSYVERKGFELVSFLQRFAQPFAVIMFIGCAILALVGAFGNASLVGKALVGMAIILVVYAVILYAPELLDFFVAWTTS